tara:strand:- start:236 stop:613 length:378 start_codon:yes stop_codon:yes gene_type:complete
MYYSGESNVPGAPGNFGNGGDLAVHPQPIDQRARDLMNLQQQNPELYQKLLNEKKVEGFAQPGGIPGMPGNQMGVQLAMGGPGGPLLPTIPKGLRPGNVPTDPNKGVRTGLTDPRDSRRGFKIGV